MCAAAALLVAVVATALGTSTDASGDTGLLPAPKRVYVVVVDGLLPADVTTARMPNLAALRSTGVWYSDSRAVFPTETLPNHAAMMTGVLPHRSGIVGNKYLPPGSDASVTAGQYNDSPAHFLSNTLVTRLERACGPSVSTASTLSKTYLYRAFTGEPESAGPDRQLEADLHWAPSPVIPVSEHSPDAATMTSGFLPWMRALEENPTPQFAFVNLGDVDRSGHADNGGNTLVDPNPTDGKAPDPGDEHVERRNGFQQATMIDTDKLLGDFVQELKDSRAWDETVMFVLSDHGMNWASQDHWIDLPNRLESTRRVDGASNYRRLTDFVVVNNGAADGVYIRENDPAERQKIVETIRNEPGVERVLVDPADASTAGRAPQHPRSAYGLSGDRAPDAVAIAAPGYSFNTWHADPSVNPVPGVHGHAVTQHSALLVTGGHPSLVSAGPGSQAKTVDGVPVWPIAADRAPLPPHGGPGVLSIAPTVAALTGLGDIAGAGYDGTLLSEAFDPGALGQSEPFCAGIDPPAPASGETGGTDPPGGGETTSGQEGRPITAHGSAETTLASGTRTASYRRPFTLRGTVTASGCTRPEWVEIRRRAAGAATYAPLAEVPTSATGRWRTELSAQRNASYVAVPDATRCDAEESRTVSVPVRARVTVRSGRTCTRRTRVTGAVQPAQPRTKVLLQRRAGKRWKTLSRARLDRRSRFSLRDARCRRGRHRVIWPRQGVSNAAGKAGFRR